jgi:hypothetical protein
MAKRDDDKLLYGIGAIVLLVLGFGGVFFGWFNPLARLFVNHSISTMQKEAERQKAEQAKSQPRP